MFSTLKPPYDMIMVDPAWSFSNWSDANLNKTAKGKYRCMSLSDIMAMPVRDLASENCLLWLWATNPMLPQAFDVMKAWGFTYKTAGHWVKRNPVSGKLSFGTGYILRCAGEPFLIGTIGSPKTSRSIRSVIEGPRREHSRKPDEAFQAAEMLMPEARRIELFSRQSRAGWDTWGDERSKFDV